MAHFLSTLTTHVSQVGSSPNHDLCILPTAVSTSVYLKIKEKKNMQMRVPQFNIGYDRNIAIIIFLSDIQPGNSQTSLCMSHVLPEP